MSTNWPMVRLAEVMTYRKEFIEIDDLNWYKRCRVQWYGQGVVLRDSLPGADLKTKHQQVCRAGDFLVAEIDAKLGGFGIVPKSLDGAVVSSHYFLFAVSDTTLDRRFLDFFIRTRAFQDQVTAQGSTNYAAIRPSDVLAYVMPLPPISDQRRIVARIEEVAARIEKARTLRSQSLVETQAFVSAQFRSAFESLGQRYGRSQLDSLITEAGYGTSEKCYAMRGKDMVPVLRIPNIAAERVDISDLKYAYLPADRKRRLHLADGDILVVRTNGSLDLVGRSAVIDDLPEPMAFASYLIRLRLDRALVLPAYAQLMLRHLRTSGQLVDFARTTAGQYNVSLGRLHSATIPVPPFMEQCRVVEELQVLQVRVDVLKRFQAQSTAELDALLPAILDRAFRGEL